jgi:hypothetical protein
LRYYADLSVRETAEALGCREGTVKSLTSDAIASLRRDPILTDAFSEHAHCKEASDA